MAPLMPFSAGLPETACGQGSTLEATREIRRHLPGVLQQLQATSLLDAPCGDHNWMRAVELRGVDYLGVDYDPEHIAVARINAPAREFKQLDIIAGPLPRADVILCRDFLQHLPDPDIWRVLHNVCDSRSWWLLATSHHKQGNPITRRGAYRALNLIKLGLGDPVVSIPDAGRMLAAWPIATIERVIR